MNIPNVYNCYMNLAAKPSRFAPSFRGGADTFVKSKKNENYELKINGKSDPTLKKWTAKFYALGLTSSHLELLNRLANSFGPDYLESYILSDESFTPEQVLDEFKEEAGLDIAALSDKELNTYLKNARNFDISMIDYDEELLEDLPLIPMLDKNQIEKTKPFMDSYNFLPVLLEVANLSDDEIKNFSETANALKNNKAIKNIPLSNADYFNIYKSKNPHVIDRLQFLSDYKTDSIYGSNFSINDGEYAINLACADDEIWNKVLKMFGDDKDKIFNTFSIQDMYKIAALEDKSYNRAAKLCDIYRSTDREIYFFEINEALKIDDEHFNNMLKYLDVKVRYHQLGIHEAQLLASIDEDEAAYVINNLKYLDYPDIEPYIASHCTEKVQDLSFVKRTDYYEILSDVIETLEKNNINDEKLKAFHRELEHSLVGADVCIDVPKQNVIGVFENFLTNKAAGTANPDFNPKISEPDNILANSQELLMSYGLNGVPLDYSRRDFLSDLSCALADSSEDEIYRICEKLSIKPIMHNKKIAGYDGILKLNALDMDNPVEEKVYGIASNFICNNEIITGDEALDRVLNSIIQAFPEFINSIGKKQTAAHHYSNDIHSLLVLAKCVSNPSYEELSHEDKTCLKLSALFHDIGKADSRLDRGHQNTSAVIVESILDKLSLSDSMKEHIFEIVQNHHWLEQLKNGQIDNQRCAFMFRRTNDFKIAKILAEADLRGIGSSDFEKYCDDLESPLVNSIKPGIEKFWAGGNAVYSSPLIKPEKIPQEVSEDGRSYRVLNFSKMKSDEDLKEYGFYDGTKKDDLRLLVHMVASDADLRRLKFLSRSNSAGVLSESLISLKDKRTYCNRNYGVVLSNLPYNVIEMSKENMGSGTKKDLKYVARTCAYSSSRTNFKNKLFEELNLKGRVTDEEFAEFYKNVLVKKKMLTQFNSNDTYALGKFKLSCEEIKNALKRVSDDFINLYEDDKHNEFTAYHPKITGVIAKSDSLDDTPKYLRDYAYENNLPIYLVGEDARNVSFAGAKGI